MNADHFKWFASYVEKAEDKVTWLSVYKPTNPNNPDSTPILDGSLIYVPAGVDLEAYIKEKREASEKIRAEWVAKHGVV